MASGDTMFVFPALAALPHNWFWVAFTSGSTEPSLSDVIWGDTSDENGELEMLVLTSGSWAGNDAAGYMLLSNPTGAPGDWTSGENFTANTSTAADHGTLTGQPASAFANFDTPRGVPVLDFDATTNQIAVFMGVMDRAYAGGGMTLSCWVAGANNTGDMDFQAAFKSVTTDVDNILSLTAGKQFAATNENAAIDAPSVVGEFVSFTITFTDGADMDSVAVGEPFFLLIMRDAQDGTNDDMAGDASLLVVEGQET